MQKSILITGATDGIGLETARILASAGHHLLIHGRRPEKLAKVEKTLSALSDSARIETYMADLSDLAEVEAMAAALTERHKHIDVLINNAGVFRTANPITRTGLDVRFVVNAIAPYLLTKRLASLLDASSRVINLSSAAQSPVDLEALAGRIRLSDDFAAYAQSKLAITAWSRSLAQTDEDEGPVMVAVNPGSMLGTKMVTESFGVAGHDIGIGADILVRAALSDEFGAASGRYYDNDSRRFTPPHPDALNDEKSDAIVNAIEDILSAGV